MAQVYGCIECGMLFAGWEFCLTHMEEQCRPRQYLESRHNQEQVKQLCMIGHPRCQVPTYQPPPMMLTNNDSLDTGHSMDSMENSSSSSSGSSDSSSPIQINSYRSEDSEVDGDNAEENQPAEVHQANHKKDHYEEDEEEEEEERVNHQDEHSHHSDNNNAPDLGHFFSESSSSEEDSVDETMLTEDYLNPVDGNNSLRQVAAVADWEQQQQQQQQQQEQQKQHSQPTRKQGLTPEEEQDEMVMDLFSPEEKESILQAMQQNMAKTPKQKVATGATVIRPPRPILVTPNQHHSIDTMTDDDDDVTNSRSPVHQQYQASRYRAQLKVAEKAKRRLQKVERCLLELIQEAAPIAADDQPKMVMLDMLPKVYQLQFGTKLDHQAMGFVSLKALLRAIPSVTIVKSSPYFGIEHEYLRCTATTSVKSLLSADDEDDSIEDDASEDEITNKFESEDYGDDVGDSFSNQKTPQHTNHQPSRFSFNTVPSDCVSSKNGKSVELEPMSALPSYTSETMDMERKQETESRESTTMSYALSPTSVDNDEVSISNSTVSSCGSSRSIVNALAEMLPNTNAFSDICRVMSKHPDGVTVGQLFQQAPEFKNFLSHCTDRRCEAQIKLAHTILKQCQQISHTRTADKTFLYFQRVESRRPAQRPLSITTKHSVPPMTKTKSSTESSLYSVSLSMSIEERAAKLFAASELTAPTGSTLSSPTTANDSKDASSESLDPPANPFKFQRPPRLETISSASLRTPTGSRSSSPQAARSIATSPQHSKSWSNAPCTPPRPRAASPRSAMPSPPSTPARELAIAESAARILAEAQLMTTPRPSTDSSTVGLSPIPNESSSPKPFKLSEEAMKTIEQYTQDGGSQVTTQSSHTAKMGYRSSSPMYFFTDEMADTPGEEAKYGVLNHAASSITVGSEADEQTKNTAKVTKVEITSKSLAEEDKPEIQVDEIGENGNYRAESSEEESFSREEIVEKLSLDLFPSTSMHYKLLVALAENSHGLTWDEVITCIPGLTAFVENFANENGIKDLHAASVLQSCPSIRSKKKNGSDLYFINAPKTSSLSQSKETLGADTTDAATVSSGMTESSTLSSTLSHQEELILDLAFANSDISATVSFLRVLKQHFTGRRWPSTSTQINQFLARSVELKSESSDMLSFRAWIYCCAGDTALPLSRKVDRAVATLVDRLQRLSCLKRQGIDLIWDTDILDGILDHATAIWKLSDVDCDHRDVPVAYVSTMDELEWAMGTAGFLKNYPENQVQSPVCVNCIGTQDELQLILLGNEHETFIFDCVKLTARVVCTALTAFFTDKNTVKVFHDAHWASSAVSNLGRIHQPLKGVFDVQLAMESLTGDPFMRLEHMVRQFGITPNQTRPLESLYFGERPLSEKSMASALDNFDLLFKAQLAIHNILHKNVHTKQMERAIQSASDTRAKSAMDNYGKRQMCLDTANGSALASLELLKTQRPTDIVENKHTVAWGKEVAGTTDIILDLLETDPTKSILFMGESSSGKTTVLQSAGHLLAENTSVSILTYGDSDTSLSKARHHLIGKDEEQSNAMLQCSRHFKPSVMVVDELERASDVESAMMCKRRSVRLLASTVVGSFRELMEDPFLSGLVRGIGANNSATAPRTRPIFDVVVELRRGAPNEYRVIGDTAAAADAIAQGTSYPVQVRTRDPVTGIMHMHFEQI